MVATLGRSMRSLCCVGGSFVGGVEGFRILCNDHLSIRGMIRVFSIAFLHLHLCVSYSWHTRICDDYLEFLSTSSLACRCFYLVMVIEAKESAVQHDRKLLVGLINNDISR